VIPAPGLRVDGLAHGAEHAQRRAVVLRHMLRAGAHQAANQRRRRVELLDLQECVYKGDTVGRYDMAEVS
jgi:hypothetical protein